MIKTDSNIVFSQHPKLAHFKDISGKTFGRLTVLGYAGKQKWYCQCACGKQITVWGHHLNHGRSKSCGCARIETKTTHGQTKFHKTTSEYTAYRNAKDRCNNPKTINYQDYGGRGIGFRFNSFDEFLTEVGKKPSPQHSLDRIDNNGHYEKGNLRWATKATQITNRRNSLCVVINGELLTPTQIAKSLQVAPSTIVRRIEKGWCLDCIIRPQKRKKCTHKSLCR